VTIILPLQNNKGQAMTEFIIIAFVLLLLTLGVVQLIFVYQAKANLNYAAFEAVRAGTQENASPIAIRHGFVRGIAPSLIRVVDDPSISTSSQDTRNTALATAYTRAYDEYKTDVRVERINPLPAHFTEANWGRIIPQWEIDQEGLVSLLNSPFYIPNEHLLNKPNTPKAGISIQDANILKLRITYCVELIVPFVNSIFENAYKLIYTNSNSVFIKDTTKAGNTKGFNQECVDRPDKRIPIVAQAIMRMQSPARDYKF